jgi:hypothetical protein
LWKSFPFFFKTFRISEVSRLFQRKCTLTLSGKVTSGNYAFWNVENTPCIQEMSNIVANVSSNYVSDDSKNIIPAWVESLPEDEKERKKKMIKLYGSPNVFTEFNPQ